MELKYKKFDDSIKTIEQMRNRAIVNALASTNTIRKAAGILKISESSLGDFIRINEISNKDMYDMRQDYKSKLIRHGNKSKNLNTKEK